MENQKMQIRWTLFGSKAKGGYFRTFESVSHPGISGFVDCEKRGQPETRGFFFEDQEFKTVGEVLAAWTAKNGGSDGKA